MEDTGRPVISCVLAPSLDTPAHIEFAERLGYRRAWCYDSPAMYADPWMVLAVAAERTAVIGLGPASLVPSLRHPVVTAAALATLAGLAPGRVSTAFGTGLTGRMLLGERPMRWAEVEEYVRTVRALLRGEEATWNGSLVRLTQPAGFAAALPADVAVLVAADGPRGRAVAAGLGDGVLTTRAPRQAAGPGGRQVLLAFGTVLGDGEDPESPRAVAAAGPALAAAYHAIYESKGASPLLDAASVAWLVTEEHVAKPGPVPASYVKNYELVTKRPDLDRAEFDRYWAQVHGPLAATIPTIRRYVQAHLLPGTREAGTAPCDGLAITWFDDVAAMRAGAATEAYARTRADEANFLAGELPFVITTERVTFPPA